MWVGHQKHYTRNTLEVKRSKVKVTRLCDVVAQKHRIYPETSLGSGNASVLSVGNRSRRSEWRGQIFDRKFLNSCFCACAVKM